ncbi:MAG: mechanosensitive ion channel family protein [Bryobacterales bacterium]|nr:mechanosensitive ion channel family protein [Bryobacterales bacterium]
MWQFPAIPELQDLPPFVAQLVRIGLIFLFVSIITRVLDRVLIRARKEIVRQLQARATGNEGIELEKRATTVGGIIRRTAKTVLWVIAIIMMLNEVGFNIAPILAGAGVVGLAVGFGAQNLVRDVITGLFMLIENQIRVNDVVVIEGQGGLVEEINLRTTVLRSLDGAVHIFPNGTIQRVTNLTREFSFYVFDIGVAYKEDTDRVVEVLKEVSDDILKDPQYAPLIIEPLEVMGVDKFADSAVVVKARIKTLPIKQWTVGREMNRRIKKKFDEAGIEIPFPHMSVYFGEASKPFRLDTNGASREEIRSIVKEVLAEAGSR